MVYLPLQAIFFSKNARTTLFPFSAANLRSMLFALRSTFGCEAIIYLPRPPIVVSTCARTSSACLGVPLPEPSPPTTRSPPPQGFLHANPVVPGVPHPTVPLSLSSYPRRKIYLFFLTFFLEERNGHFPLDKTVDQWQIGVFPMFVVAVAPQELARIQRQTYKNRKPYLVVVNMQFCLW